MFSQARILVDPFSTVSSEHLHEEGVISSSMAAIASDEES